MRPRKLALNPGRGDYIRPGDDAVAAQQAVIEAIELHAPQVIADLAVSEDVDAWARRWRLDTTWMRSQAEETRELWRDYPHILTDTAKYPRPSWLVTGPECGDWVGLADDAGISWNPRTEPESAFRERVEAYVAQRRADAEAEQHGFVRVPRRDREHFEWFVRHHVLDEPYAAIAARKGETTASGVETAVKRIARLVGLSLR